MRYVAPPIDAEGQFRAPSAPPCLELQFGLDGMLRALPAVAAIAAALATFVSPAASGWKTMVLALLVPCAFLLRRADRRRHRPGLVRINPDGTARLRLAEGPEIRAVLKQNAWTCQWFSVLLMFEPEINKHYHCFVCASANTAGDYRRLLKFLRMRGSAPGTDKAQLL